MEGRRGVRERAPRKAALCCRLSQPSRGSGAKLALQSRPRAKLKCCCCSVTKSCPTLCHPMDCSTAGFPVHPQLPELAQTHVHRVGDAIQPSHPLSSPSPSAFHLSQHQGLFQGVGSSHQVAKVLELQLQHQTFQ